MKRRRKRPKAQTEQWSKAKAGRLLVKRVKKVPLSEYHGKRLGSNPNSWRRGGRLVQVAARLIARSLSAMRLSMVTNAGLLQ
jgi:hypothetical protein